MLEERTKDAEVIGMTPDIEYAYDLLEVTPDVSDKEMRSAWRKLVRRYHPDLAKTDPEEASRRMAEINAAYDAVAHHRSQTDKQPDPKSQHKENARAAQAARRAAQKAEEAKRQRAARQEELRKAAYAKRKAEREQAAKRQTTLKKAATWNSREQSLIDAARAAFEETRRKLGDAARRPVFSACH